MNSEKEDKNKRAIEVFQEYRDLIKRGARILDSFDILPAQELIDSIEAFLSKLGEFKDDISSTQTFEQVKRDLNELLEKLRGNPEWNNVFAEEATQKKVNFWDVLHRIVDPFDRGSSS